MTRLPERPHKQVRTAKIVALPATGVIRLARVAEARRRIAEGWYDRADVRDSLVEAVLLEFRGH